MVQTQDWIPLHLIEETEKHPLSPEFELYIVYIQGYFEASLNNLKQCKNFSLSEDENFHNSAKALIYPTMFLVRHLLELLIKFVIRALRPTETIDEVIDYYQKKSHQQHNLSNLSSVMFNVTTEYFEGKKEGFSELLGFERCLINLIEDIEYFEGKDPTGFRYPHTKVNIKKRSLNVDGTPCIIPSNIINKLNELKWFYYNIESLFCYL